MRPLRWWWRHDDRRGGLAYAAYVAVQGTVALWLLSDGDPAALCLFIPYAGACVVGAVEARRLAREYREDCAWHETALAHEEQAAAWNGGASRL
jgi:hypothetical protein